MFDIAAAAFLWGALSFTAAFDFKLSDSKLLLPYYSFASVNYTLRGSDSTCYTWRSGTPEVAIVTPVGVGVDSCSTEAVVTVMWQSSHRAVTTIYARVATTGHVVKCDVIVDDIHRIEIETTTQELYLHNTPEKLSVVAFDEYGNTFSTLEGVPFDWRIVYGDNHKSSSYGGLNVLKFLTWTESEYVTPKSIADLESKGLQGYVQLVSGLRTGSAVVRVSLMEHVYERVPMAQVRLLVLANAQLRPALAFLMPFASLKLQVTVIQLGRDKIVSMPSAQYHLRVNDTSMLELDSEDGSTITALHHGQTEVTLLDRNVDEAMLTLPAGSLSDATLNDMPHLPRRRLPTSLIYVVEPSYLGFTLQSPTNSRLCQTIVPSSVRPNDLRALHQDTGNGRLSWIMEVGQIYIIQLDVYDHSNRRLYPTDNMRLELTVPNDKIKILESTVNGTYFVVEPLAPGSLSIEAKLLGLLNKRGELLRTETFVAGSQELTIFSPIVILPSVILLPWPVAATVPHQLTALGGTGNFTWSILSNKTNDMVIDLSPDGAISAMSLGTTTIVASSPSHPQLCGIATVHVVHPATIQFVPGPTEIVLPFHASQTKSADLPRQLLVSLAVLDAEGRCMTDCRGLDIKFEPVDSSLLKVLPDRLAPRVPVMSSSFFECMRVPVVGLDNTGFAELQAFYQPPPPLGSAAALSLDHSDLQAVVYPIAIYRELLFLNPASAITHVALGSTRNFVVLEGPRPWPLDTSKFFSSIHPIADSNVDPSTFPSILEAPRAIYEQLTGNTEQRTHFIAFSLRCEFLGTFSFNLEVGNHPTTSNIAPITMHSQFKIICDVPHSVQLQLRRPIPGSVESQQYCPLLNTSVLNSSDKMWIPNTVPSSVVLNYFNVDGRPLDGVDSLTTKVSIHEDGGSHTIGSHLVADSAPKVHLSSRPSFAHSRHPPPLYAEPHFFVTPARPSISVGAVNVHVESLLRDHYAQRLRDAGQPIVRLQSELVLELTPSVELLPRDTLRLFHLLGAELSVTLAGGSGFFSVQQQFERKHDGDLLLTLVESGTTGSWSVSPRRVGHGHLQVIDLCFPQLPASPDQTVYHPVVVSRPVNVVGLASLVLHVSDRVELGKEITASFEALDVHGSPVPLELLQELELHLDPLTDQPPTTHPIVSIPNVFNLSSTQSLRFQLRGLSLGVAYVSVWTTSLKLDQLQLTTVRSNVVEIQVFAPLSLSPCDFNLLVGAEYELRAQGGPSHSTIEFLLLDPPDHRSSRAQLFIEQKRPNSVLVRAGEFPGPVIIHARSIGPSLSSTDANRVESVISAASCTLYIVSISGIRIATPLASSTELTSSTSEQASSDVFDRFMIGCRDSDCPSAPLWVEGIPFSGKSAQASGGTLSPMHMAGVVPRLRYKWRLTPPSVAKLFHHSASFNVDVAETNTGAGMTLVGLSPGRVTIQLTVECDDETRSSVKVLVDSTGSRVSHLSAQLTVVILPPLGLQSPLIRSPRQLLMSPESDYRLQVFDDLLQSASVVYTMFNVSTSRQAPILTITSTGVLRADSLLHASKEFRSTVRIESRSTYGALPSDPRITQTMLLDVLVKPPRYAMVTAVPGNYVHSNRGLIVGGPYRLDVSFHDEFGRKFDAVAAQYQQLTVDLHRTDLIRAQLFSATHPCAGHACSKLELYVSSPEVAHPPNSVLRIGRATADLFGFWPIYLTIPHGGELVSGLPQTPLHVTQWGCLPELVAGATWSSSDPNILWVGDKHNRVLLARREGRVYLTYTTPPRVISSSSSSINGTTSEEPLSYVVRVATSAVTGGVDTQLLHINSDDDRTAGPNLLPVVAHYAASSETHSISPITMKFLVQFHATTRSQAQDKSPMQPCAPLDAESKTQLASAAPIHCSFRVKQPSPEAAAPATSQLVPTWLRTLLMWNYTDLTNPDLDTISFAHLIRTQLEPVSPHSPFHSATTQWQCVLRTNESWARVAPWLGLLLAPNEMIELSLTLADSDQSRVLATAVIHPLPGFQMVVPPAILEGSEFYHFWINDPSKLTRRLLIFLPPSTASAMLPEHLNIERLVARSSSPDVLEISSKPTPVSSLVEASQILKEYVASIGSVNPSLVGGSRQLAVALKLWASMASVQIQHLDNEASSSTDLNSLIKQRVLWTVDVRAFVGESALDTTVDVIVSLRPTGQHLTIPVHVRLPSKASLIESGQYYGWPWLPSSLLSLTWSHLIVSVVFTLLLAFFVSVFTAYVKASTGSNVLKNLPATSTPPSRASLPSGSPRPLWSGGYPLLNSPPSAYGGVYKRPVNRVSPGVPHSAGDLSDLSMEEQKWRHTLSAGSPSRLRETFDAI